MAKKSSGMGFNVFEFKSGKAQKIFEYHTPGNDFEEGVRVIGAKFNLDSHEIFKDIEAKIQKIHKGLR